MIAPISAGIEMFVCVTSSIQSTPAIAPGSAIRMMSGSSHDWKLTAMSRYEHHRQHHAAGERREARPHRLRLPADGDERPPGQRRTDLVDDALDGARHRPEGGAI